MVVDDADLRFFPGLKPTNGEHAAVNFGHQALGGLLIGGLELLLQTPLIGSFTLFADALDDVPEENG
ncbi:MAG: hypothetical protein AMXMBFR34_35550 [Myxococcaceae bacterium]